MLPTPSLLLHRAVVATNVLMGRCDDLPRVSELLMAERDKVVRMRKALENTQEQQKYWYNLWFTMAREFEAGQNMLIEKIEELQKKCGEYDKPFLDGLAQKGFHDKFVDPKGHPIPILKSKHEGLAIDVPPVKVTVA